jgi:hypothetical protein
MAAKIIAQSPGSATIEFWLEDDVIRIGGAPDCDLPLAGLAAHAITVQERGGRHFAFNRSNEAIQLGTETVAPGQSGQWDFGCELCFDNGTQLLLQSAVEAQLESPTLWSDGEVREPAPNQADGSKDKQTKMAVVAIGCVVVLACIFGGSGGNSRSTTAVFEQLIQDRLWEHSESDSTARQVLDALQRARIAELRGDSNTAEKKYVEAKDVLWTAKDSGTEPFLDVDQRTLDFVTKRLLRM